MTEQPLSHDDITFLESAYYLLALEQAPQGSGHDSELLEFKEQLDNALRYRVWILSGCVVDMLRHGQPSGAQVHVMYLSDQKEWS